MKLYIDTTNNLRTIVKLDNKQLIKTYKSPRSQDLVTAISELLTRENKTLKDITAIKVNPGPGSFTSLRVGIAVANALSFALNLKQRHATAHYGQPPSITL